MSGIRQRMLFRNKLQKRLRDALLNASIYIDKDTDALICSADKIKFGKMNESDWYWIIVGNLELIQTVYSLESNEQKEHKTYCKAVSFECLFDETDRGSEVTSSNLFDLFSKSKVKISFKTFKFIVEWMMKF